MIDWELERNRNLSLQLGHDAVTAKAVFNAVERACDEARWERHVRAYRKAARDPDLARIRDDPCFRELVGD